MPKQIITLEVKVTEDVLRECGEPNTWDYEEAIDGYLEETFGHETEDVTVLQASHLMPIPSDEEG